MQPMRLHRLIASLLTGVALASCAQTQPAMPAAAPKPESERLALELRTLIGPAACSADAQCRTVPVGAKACGGPGGYWAWSSAGVDEARLRDLAQRQSQAAAAENTRSGMLSNCAIVADPGARCEASRCVLRPPAAANAAR